MGNKFACSLVFWTLHVSLRIAPRSPLAAVRGDYISWECLRYPEARLGDADAGVAARSTLLDLPQDGSRGCGKNLA